MGLVGGQAWNELGRLFQNSLCLSLAALVGEGQAQSHWALVSGFPPLFTFG